MKILNLKIYDKSNNLIRDISFSKDNVSFVYGNVLMPEKKKETSNSIGKTLTLRMCNYIFGCNVDKNLLDKKLGDYKLIAIVEHEGKTYNITRSLDDSVFLIDGEKTNLTNYKDFFNIDRNKISRQIVLAPKGSLIGYNKNPTYDDYVTYLSMLGLKDLSNDVKEYYDIMDKIKKLEDSKKEILQLLNFENTNIDEQIFINDKNIEELEQALIKIRENVNNIKTSEEDIKLQGEYEELSEKSKSIQSEISKMNIELAYLKKYINSTAQSDYITIEDMKKIYSVAKYEVPEMIIKKIEEVEDFYKNVIEDRLNTMGHRVDEINMSINLKKQEVEGITKKMDDIGKILSDNAAYHKALNILSEYNNRFSEEKFKQGKLYQIKTTNNSIEKNRNDQINKFNTIKENINLSKPLIKTFKDYVYNIVKDIYIDNVSAYFEISNGEFRKNSSALKIDLNLKGEGGEGVMEVKKNIMDILLFKYNINYDILILDSSCFNGIDTRQIQGLLSAISDVCKETNKQAIISINKYQLTKEYIDYVEENCVIELSEVNKLLGYDF